MKTHSTPTTTENTITHEHLLEAARLVGDLLREDRRAADRSLAGEFAASEAELTRWFNLTTP